MQITPQSQQYGLPERKSRTLPAAREVADLMRGPSIPHGTMGRNRTASGGVDPHMGDDSYPDPHGWQQVPNGTPEPGQEQWVRSHPGGSSAMVENYTSGYRGDQNPWTWSHFDTDINGPEAHGAEHPSEWNAAPTREEAMAAADGHHDRLEERHAWDHRDDWKQHHPLPDFPH